MTNKSYTFNSEEEKVSYGFGLQFGQQLLRNHFEGLDIELVSLGIRDILEKQAIKISEDELNKAYASVQQELQKKEAEKAKKMTELSLSFLEENARREGVQVTDSGLQYEILEEGTGDKPKASDTVETHYHGTFIDGTVFDSSVNRDETATFAVNQVIKGWTEALQMMNTGAKWRIVCPAALAYGDAGAPPSIPGGSTLVFEIHLIDIVS